MVKHFWLTPLILLLFGGFSSAAGAVTIRYALIIGNNNGVDNDGSRPFAPLRHAEREASVLREKLVRLASFDPSGARTRLLLGATRQEVSDAINSLVAKQQKDRAVFGKTESLFLFYYTGHGLDGRLLLEDGALSSEEIGYLFTRIGADFSIGVFDACFSGSLDKSLLAAKGIHPSPRLNLFRELPEEVLSAEGRIWYVSSGSNQESFEDEKLGGVFTHFFIEALERGEVTGPGITLENVWQYARSNTVAYTAARNRIQIPEQFIAQLRSNAPIFFSFVERRSATLVLSEAMEGRFALSYAAGNLTEVFEKKKGRKQILAVYPGDAHLMLADRRDKVTTQRVLLKSGERLFLGSMDDPSATPFVGEASETLFEKGQDLSMHIEARHIKSGLSVFTGFGYDFSLAHDHTLFARHGFFVPFRFDRGPVFFNAEAAYGFDKRAYPSWTHRVHEIGGSVVVGCASNFSFVRLGAGVGFGADYLMQMFDEGETRTGFQLRPLINVNMLFDGNKRLYGALYADVGAMYAPGIGEASDNLWQVFGTLGGTVYFRIR